MQRILFFCVAGLLSLNVSAQKNARAGLQIGDTLPDLPFQEFLDISVPQMQLTDLKGKLVILDFWNVKCLACLQSMPKMASLQKRFGERIQIILITQNTRTEVETLFSRIKIQKPSLPFVIADTNYYKKLFPHVGDPLHVWINNKGVISAITDGHNATVSHIQSMLDGEKINLSVRAPEGPLLEQKDCWKQVRVR